MEETPSGQGAGETVCGVVRDLDSTPDSPLDGPVLEPKHSPGEFGEADLSFVPLAAKTRMYYDSIKSITKWRYGVL